MAKTITVGVPEPLDAVCRRHYGDESGYVEAVLDVNHGIAALGPILPTGTVLTLPDIEIAPEASAEIVTLW